MRVKPDLRRKLTFRRLGTVLRVNVVRAPGRLPGEELVDRGLRDLAAGVESIELFSSPSVPHASGVSV
jgi:hypothetical protein